MLTDAVKVLVEAVSAFRGLANTFSGGESSYVTESVRVLGLEAMPELDQACEGHERANRRRESVFQRL
jgi:hypothetical protein